MAEKINDVICRRVPIGFLNKDLAKGIINDVADIMANEKKWNAAHKKAEIEEALKNLEFMK